MLKQNIHLAKGNNNSFWKVYITLLRRSRDASLGEWEASPAVKYPHFRRALKMDDQNDGAKLRLLPQREEMVLGTLKIQKPQM